MEMNNASRANETGLSRRRLLMGLAVSATAATVAQGAAGKASECPDLLALGDKIEGAARAHRQASAEVARIISEWGPQWPVPDASIIRYGQGTRLHSGIDGRGIETPWSKSGDIMRVQNLGTPEYFQRSAERHKAEYERKMKTKSQRGAKGEKLWMERDTAAIEPAKAYWSEVDRITKASGIDAAHDAQTKTREALMSLVDEILAYPEQTMTGVVIKAQALAAWGEVDALHRLMNIKAPMWADHIATSIVRQASAA